MQTYKFRAQVNNGKISIPQQYRNKLGKLVKVIVISEDDQNDPVVSSKKFHAVSLSTSGYRFNRNEANER